MDAICTHPVRFYFHLNGARSMISKCLGKFEGVEMARGMDISELKEQIKKVQNHFDSIRNKSEIQDSYILRLKVLHE